MRTNRRSRMNPRYCRPISDDQLDLILRAMHSRTDTFPILLRDEVNRELRAALCRLAGGRIETMRRIYWPRAIDLMASIQLRMTPEPDAGRWKAQILN